jgi:uncharacterized membrane protein YidH (DUF202 family)
MNNTQMNRIGNIRFLFVFGMLLSSFGTLTALFTSTIIGVIIMIVAILIVVKSCKKWWHVKNEFNV